MFHNYTEHSIKYFETITVYSSSKLVKCIYVDRVIIYYITLKNNSYYYDEDNLQ